MHIYSHGMDTMGGDRALSALTDESQEAFYKMEKWCVCGFLKN